MNTLSRTLAVLTVVACLRPAAEASAEVVGVTITTRAPVADGRVFGPHGTYEQLTGRIEFALDPADPHNRGIVDLEYAPRDAKGRVHFTSDLSVLRPSDPGKGNGVMLFEVANRGNKELFGTFMRGAVNDSITAAGVGDGFLMNEGYTLVWVGWEFDVPVTGLRLTAPPVTLPDGVGIEPLSVDLTVDQRMNDAFIIDAPSRPPVIYPPLDPASAINRLTVRKTFWDAEVAIPRDRWRFLTGGALPKVQFDDGFEPGLLYRVTYRPAFTVVSGVGFAAIRDAAAAFRQRTDLPVHAERAYVYGNSQTGRYLRTLLLEGFNVDEQDRRVFDAVWSHIAGGARGMYNRRFATPSHGDMFAPTQFPFADADESDVDGSRGGLQSRYRPEQRAKVFYTNTPVEYWGGGRAAALIHTSVDGARDLPIPDNVRIYLLAGAQHLPFPFPPGRRPVPGAHGRNGGQQLANPLPQMDIMRALLQALHRWASDDLAPPPSQYPRLRDGTLVALPKVKFPPLPGVADPRTIVGPGRMIGGAMVPLPFLVPQVNQDGNDAVGIRDPELTVPLATYTGWNFRDVRTGNPEDISQILGSYIPFPRTRNDARQSRDPRRSIAERYRSIDDYMRRITTATDDLIRRRFLLAEDRAPVLARAKEHWLFAVTSR